MKIALLGDIALFGCNKVSNRNFRDKFAPVKLILDECDYVVGNLETPLTNVEKNIGGKSAYIKGCPEDIEILQYLNVSHVSLANNHSFDYKQQGLDETIKLLEKSNIEWYGVNGKKCLINKEGSSLILMGYCCYSTNAKGMGIINILNPLEIEKELENFTDALPILSLHWGEEHIHYPNYDHVMLARKLCRRKKIIIHGHHPHVLQGIEKLEQSIVFYSLGNFCFDDVYTNKSKKPLIELSEDNREVAVILLEIEKNKVVNYEIRAFLFDSQNYFEKDGVNDKLEMWSSFLSNEVSYYNKVRQNELNIYLSARKKKRDLNWYLKRLNFESVKMILSSVDNKRKYELLLNRYIKS